MTETVEELERQIDAADEHTVFLMEKIAGLETRLKAAEFAAAHNWSALQQEIGRAASDGRAIKMLVAGMENEPLRDSIWAICDTMIRTDD